MKKKFEFSFKCDENPLKMEKSALLTGEKTINTRHCTKCERNIVDFTKFTPQQISDYIKNNKKPCGFMFPWQEGQINDFLSQGDAKISPLKKLVKVAAMIGSPLMFSPAFAQKNTPETEMVVSTRNESGIVTEVILKDINGEPLNLIELEVYLGNQLISTLTTNELGKISFDHSAYKQRAVLTLKNKALDIENTITLKSEGTCIVWQTTFTKNEKAIIEQTNKFDLEFIYKDKNDKPIRFTKVDVELYDSTNNLFETITVKTNISGISNFKTSNIAKTQHISFVLYTKDGRRTAYLNTSELSKTEMNTISVNKKFRQHFMGIMVTKF